jgi:hypothetical protein
VSNPRRISYCCEVCGYVRSEDGEKGRTLRHDLYTHEGWIFPQWGTVCGQCVRRHKGTMSIWSLKEIVQTHRAAKNRHG